MTFKGRSGEIPGICLGSAGRGAKSLDLLPRSTRSCQTGGQLRGHFVLPVIAAKIINKPVAHGEFLICQITAGKAVWRKIIHICGRNAQFSWTKFFRANHGGAKPQVSASIGTFFLLGRVKHLPDLAHQAEDSERLLNKINLGI